MRVSHLHLLREKQTNRWHECDEQDLHGVVEGAVGVLIPASLLQIVAHLGLGLRGMQPCVLSPFAPLRSYQLSRVACRAILTDADDAVVNIANGFLSSQMVPYRGRNGPFCFLQ